MNLKLAILAGDGIGPEVTQEAVNILTLASVCLLGGCASPKAAEIPGTYVYTAGMYAIRDKHQIQTFELKANRTYVRHASDGQLKNGTWRRTESIYTVAIELDGDEFPLIYRDKQVCWEAREDYEYWCKTQK